MIRNTFAPLALLIALAPSGCSILSLVKPSSDEATTTEDLADRELAEFEKNRTVEQWWRAMDQSSDLAVEAGEEMRKKGCAPQSKEGDCAELAAQREKGRKNVKQIYAWIFDHIDSKRADLARLGGTMARYQGSDDLVDLLDVDKRFPFVAEKLESVLSGVDLEKTARDTGEGVCAASEQPHSDFAPKALFRGANTSIHVRCAFPERLSSYHRDRPDVLRVDVAGAGSWMTVTTLDVSSYDSTVADFELPVSRVVSSMTREREHQGLKPYKGSWIMVMVQYIRAERTGSELNNNRVEDVWQTYDLGRGSFVVQSG